MAKLRKQNFSEKSHLREQKTIILLSILFGSEIGSFILKGISILQILRPRKLG